MTPLPPLPLIERPADLDAKIEATAERMATHFGWSIERARAHIEQAVTSAEHTALIKEELAQPVLKGNRHQRRKQKARMR